MPTELSTEILVIGGGLGGVSAALAAVRLGRKVVLLEELDWLGGQLTSQGVPLDEAPWAEYLINSQSFAALRAGIRKHYQDYYPLTPRARVDPLLNPGMGNVGTLCCEPAVAAKVLDALLAPFVSTGALMILRRHRLTGCATHADKIAAVNVTNLENGKQIVISAAVVIDATETGDVLAMADVEHVLGAESQSETNELHAITGPADALDQQALTWGFAVDYLPEEDHTIDKPKGYDTFRDLKLDFWPGAQFGWTVSNHVTHEPLERRLFAGDTDDEYVFDLWHARRILSRRNFLPGAFASDITIANWPQIDYWLKPAVGVSLREADAALDEARRFSLSFLYWMQTEAPRHDGGAGYRGLRLRGDVLGTRDGLAKQAYFREGRRIRAEFTILEQHIGVEARSGQQAAENFPDSVGVGAYRIDLHPSTTGRRDTVDIDTYPFEIPLGALLPVRVDNLLPACKNLGTTRITNGAYRVHPVEWSIGEASGALAAYSLQHRVPPRAIRQNPTRLYDFQSTLDRLGVLRRWPTFDALRPGSRRGYRPPAQ
ncbi:FAD-dependent oxidoreductase [Bradyrhizobium sp. CIAT3101]|uniref:FAD-dependent oxidoreductase n=1 Tax=Bradyrhizobium sp. CIAT3101 TaxID=439387 RepID=UPI0024B0E4EA|nr:FAD-dependent oxidoreductase [Bradyrhizobium sp. CIAT3101]WFU78196.1 FAD-dependent oxidoreductase [Bradyrhizobium sp. CIAT3101]